VLREKGGYTIPERIGKVELRWDRRLDEHSERLAGHGVKLGLDSKGVSG